VLRRDVGDNSLLAVTSGDTDHVRSRRDGLRRDCAQIVAGPEHEWLDAARATCEREADTLRLPPPERGLMISTGWAGGGDTCICQEPAAMSRSATVFTVFDRPARSTLDGCWFRMRRRLHVARPGASRDHVNDDDRWCVLT
jgi:hypothetical protein